MFNLGFSTFSDKKTRSSGFSIKKVCHQIIFFVTNKIFFKKRWYGRSTTFTVNPEELKFKPKAGQNDRSNQHLGEKEFDKEIHKKYLKHKAYH